MKRVVDDNTAGIWYGIFAYTIWGILPLYWKLLQAVPPLEILYHRIVWSFVFVLIIVAVGKGWRQMLVVLRDKKRLLLMFLCGFVISLNWYTYIYAVNTGHVIEASMGYFINPLVVVLFGVTIVKERLTRWQLVALVLAALGVLIVTIQYGRVPWLALILAVSFALYGLIKKMARVEPVMGLALETMVVTPIALYFILGLERAGIGAMGNLSFTSSLILAGAGVITATPLLLFARGVERTTLSMMGFLQYIAPSMTLILGIFVFREPFFLSHFISFCFIWAALIIFTLANTGILKEYPRAE